MDTKIKNKIFRLPALAALMLTAPLMQGCLDEVDPTNVAVEKQIEDLNDASTTLLNGLNAEMVEQFSYSGSANHLDWGYPSQMMIRDVLGGDEPASNSYNDFDFEWLANGEYLTYFPLYTYNWYYELITNTNNIARMYDVENSSNKPAAGIALTYRALAYFDLARMFEYKTTGFEELDSKATDVKGLTVPIVTENTTAQDSKKNPRAPFYTMYRFILTDLNKAEQYLADYDRGSSRIAPDLSVVYGMKARVWLELASRFDQSPSDLTEMVQHDSDDDGYDAIGVTTAQQCYQNALNYARQAISLDGYSPLTNDQWHNSKTGFNSASSNNSWMWCCSMGAKEMLGYQWYSWFCDMCSESPTISWGGYFDCYRCIDRALYDRIPDADWRKTSWVDPDDAGAATVPSKYETVLTNSEWSSLPAYANLKFRLGSGDKVNKDVGLLGDIPLMRVEEMYFIAAEAAAHTQGMDAGRNILVNFMNTYRYTDGSYTCNVPDLNAFINELMVQKRIEFWGEGLVFFDNKRLNRQIRRYYDGSNYPDSYQLNSKAGYCAPWLNYYIYDYEFTSNTSVIPNPDPSEVVKSQTNY